MKTIGLSIMFIVMSGTGFTQSIPADSLYLGNEQPGTTRKQFSIDHQNSNVITECIAISNDGKEIYFAEGTPPTHWMIRYYTYSDSGWSNALLLFDGYSGPSLSPGNDTLFFHKYFDVNNWLSNVYFSVRNDTHWSTPSIFAGDKSLGWLQITDAGNYYVINQDESAGISEMDISNSDTIFSSLGLGKMEYFIARNDSFIIFSSNRSGGFGNNDLYISFRENHNSWTDPANLGSSVNTSGWDVSPYITPDKKFLFFVKVNSTGGRTLYWIRIDELIDSLKTQSNLSGSKEVFYEQDIAIYPSESGKQLNITFGEIPFSEVRIEIYNLSGICIYSLTVYDQTSVRINLAGNRTGIYIVKLSVNEVTYTRKISFS